MNDKRVGATERQAFSDSEERMIRRASLSVSADLVSGDRGYASDDLQRNHGQ